MVVRRQADPTRVQHVWNAICYLDVQKQSADAQRVSRFLQKTYDYSQSQCQLYFKHCIKDGLLTVVQKGPKGGNATTPTETDIFKTPSSEQPELDGSDWYCFECHLAGDVQTCKKCFRVFHADCVTTSRNKHEKYRSMFITKLLSEEVRERDIRTTSCSYDDTVCSICNISQLPDFTQLENVELNYLLKFVLHRIRAWLPLNITHTMAVEDRPAWITDSELIWRANHLFFEHRDMSVVEVNLNNESYKNFWEFHADILTIQHNVAIFHGCESQEYGATELMVRDCLHDLTELCMCSDCYRHSNEKINNRWYCLPCRQPHRLVWAKQKGYPYWPAKVIRETMTHYDVRFFGGKYERALLMKSFIKPITTSKESLQIKHSAAFNKAFEELIYHQKLLEEPEELQNLLAASKQKRRLLSPKKTPALPASPEKETLGEDSNKVPGGTPTGTTRAAKRKQMPLSSGVPGAPSPIKRQALTEMQSPSTSGVDHVIDITNMDDEDDAEYSFRDSVQTDCGNMHEQVSSSTENFKDIDSTPTDCEMQQLDHPYSDAVEKMRRKLMPLTDKKEITKTAMDCMQAEIDKITNDHNDQLKRLFESHNAQISETKKKQWCYYCEQDAIYHCCWNTAYCSQTCQQQHWQAEHKKVCRRKR